MIDFKHYGLSPLQFIKIALDEDAGDGDHTSLSTIGEEKTGTAMVLMKEGGIVSGLEVASLILKSVDNHINIQTNFMDGKQVLPGKCCNATHSLYTIKQEAFCF